MNGKKCCSDCTHLASLHPSFQLQPTSSAGCQFCGSTVQDMSLHKTTCHPYMESLSSEYYENEIDVNKHPVYSSNEQNLLTKIYNTLSGLEEKIDGNTLNFELKNFLNGVWVEKSSVSICSSNVKRKNEFRQKAQDYYNSDKCIVTGDLSLEDMNILKLDTGPSHIIAAHLWPHRLHDDQIILPRLFSQLKSSEVSDKHPVDSPRNCVFLHEKIEKYFDQGRVTFLPVEQGHYKFCVADPQLKKSLKILHYKDIRFPNNKFPYNRIIALHYFIVAKKYQLRIDKNFGLLIRLSFDDEDPTWVDTLVKSASIACPPDEDDEPILLSESINNK